jgi:hypothetical protein
VLKCCAFITLPLEDITLTVLTRGCIVVAGAVAQRPKYGGHTWALMQYVLGFRRLGWDVLFLDEIEPDACTDASGDAAPIEASVNLSYFRDVMDRFGLSESAALIERGTGRTFGIARGMVRERVRQSLFVLNIMGFLRDTEILAAAHRRVFLDIDPGFGQLWYELGLADLFRGHDVYVTVGENIGQPDCAIPTCGLPWIRTRPPVVLDYWPMQADLPAPRFTSVASWRGPFGPVAYRGVMYGLRVHEFRKFAALPQSSAARFAIALDIDANDARDRALLDAHGWRLLDPRAATGDPWRYRDFVQRSGAELMIAKQIYVAMRSGWFSDRSACYLASGRPVLAQDTGFSRTYPTGMGLVVFATLEEARQGVEAILAEPLRHALAARRIAEEFFDSDTVLARLVERVA